MKIKVFSWLLSAAVLTSCSGFEVNEQTREELDIFPDYKGVTVPYNIAPLNFMTDCFAKGKVKVEASDGSALVCRMRNGKVCFPVRKWRALLESAKGATLTVTVMDNDSKAYESFEISVAEEPVDRYIAYRLIDPGYVLWNEMGIYQRDLESFRQRAVVENRDLDHACVNCHSFADRDPEAMVFHARTTAHGGTYVTVDGRFEKLDTKTPQTISALVYPSWHTSRRYIAFSVNETKQSFHVSDPYKIEVYDMRSDVVVYDVNERTLVTDEALFSGSAFETFPSFSKDGSKLFYCSADSLLMPTSYRDLKYSLCSIEFNEEDASFGKVDTLVRAGEESVTMPRMSPDASYMLYTSSEYGNFTVWHKDADLALIDLTTGERIDVGPWNSDDADSWHSWSGNSRWVVFSTRRIDGSHTRLYLGYLGKDGKVGKAFLLPQKDPEHNMRLMKSYNIPEFVQGKISSKGYAVRNSREVYKVEFTGDFKSSSPDASTGASVNTVN